MNFTKPNGKITNIFVQIVFKIAKCVCKLSLIKLNFAALNDHF